VKAILHSRYGPPDLLQLRDVDKPVPNNNEVLIAIHATTVSTADCNLRNFTFVTKSMRPIAKLMVGIGKPGRPASSGPLRDADHHLHRSTSRVIIVRRGLPRVTLLAFPDVQRR
jgi:hypothetical protein